MHQRRYPMGNNIPRKESFFPSFPIARQLPASHSHLHHLQYPLLPAASHLISAPQTPRKHQIAEMHPIISFPIGRLLRIIVQDTGVSCFYPCQDIPWPFDGASETWFRRGRAGLANGVCDGCWLRLLLCGRYELTVRSMGRRERNEEGLAAQE